MYKNNFDFIRNNYKNLSKAEIKKYINSAKINKIKNHPYSSIYNIYKESAKIRTKKYNNDVKYQFELTLEDFINLIKQECYYCGSFPSNKISYENIFLIYNGIDRFDNNLGYIKENCVSCCSNCNIAKGTMKSNEFIHHFLKLIKYQMEKS